MSFPRYAEYKDSGVEWLGEVPKAWQVQQFRRYVFIAEGQVDPEHEQYRGMVLVAPNHVESGTGRLLELQTAEQQAAESGKYLCAPDDVIYSKIRPALRKVCLAPSMCLCSADMYPLRCAHGLSNRYLVWFILSEQFSSLAVLESERVAMPKINRETLNEVALLLPNEIEQVAIAAFLDRETSKIDALVAEQEKLIALLKEKRQAVISHAVTKGLNPDAPMKPSGIESLGDVPAHWDVKSLKFVARVQTGIAKGKDNEDRNVVSVPYLRVANVQDGYLDLTEVAIIEIAADALPRYLLQVGDVLMNEGGDFDKLGRGHVWRGEIDPCIHQNHVFAVRPVEISSEWLNLVTGSGYAQFYFMTRSKQSTNLASISSTNLMELPMLIPPEKERNSIIEFVGAETSCLDLLNAEANRTINLLKERRSALISAAVTGQIDVRDLSAPEKS